MYSKAISVKEIIQNLRISHDWINQAAEITNLTFEIKSEKLTLKI